jgi:hypothetical protein
MALLHHPIRHFFAVVFAIYAFVNIQHYGLLTFNVFVFLALAYVSLPASERLHLKRHLGLHKSDAPAKPRLALAPAMQVATAAAPVAAAPVRWAHTQTIPSAEAAAYAAGDNVPLVERDADLPGDQGSAFFTPGPAQSGEHADGEDWPYRGPDSV